MVGRFIDWIQDKGASYEVVFIAIFAILVGTLSNLWPGFTHALFAGALTLSPIWLPIFLGIVFWHLWITYIQIDRILKTDHTLLEIKLPSEVTQSPLAMETVLNVMYHVGEPAQFIEGYWEGRTRPQFSLEIASFEGSVHFFIRTRTSLKNMLEAQIYSHYPSVEVHEVEDYTKQVRYDEETMQLFGIEQKLREPDPYPIKTYVDFGLDQETKEEFKIDPVSGILEFLNSFGKDQYCWIQIIIRSHELVRSRKSYHFGKSTWQVEAETEVDKILKRDSETKGPGQVSPAGFPILPSFSREEQALADKVLRNTAKKPFETGIRVIYFGDKDKFDKSQNNGLPTMFRQFEDHRSNGLKPTFPTGFNWPWQNLFGIAGRRAKRIIFDAYRWRSYLTPPHRRDYFILSAEEIASLFHFPGRVSQAPMLQRIGSRKAEAPPNLPK
jgi:hypothetical protein